MKLTFAVALTAYGEREVPTLQPQVRNNVICWPGKGCINISNPGVHPYSEASQSVEQGIDRVDIMATYGKTVNGYSVCWPEIGCVGVDDLSNKKVRDSNSRSSNHIICWPNKGCINISDPGVHPYSTSQIQVDVLALFGKSDRGYAVCWPDGGCQDHTGPTGITPTVFPVTTNDGEFRLASKEGNVVKSYTPVILSQNIICWPNKGCIDFGNPGVHPYNESEGSITIVGVFGESDSGSEVHAVCWPEAGCLDHSDSLTKQTSHYTVCWPNKSCISLDGSTGAKQINIKAAFGTHGGGHAFCWPEVGCVEVQSANF